MYRVNISDNYFYRSFPKYSIETLALFLIALLSSILINYSKNTNIVPLLGFIALALQKIIPSFQMMYSSWAYIVGTKEESMSALKILNQGFIDTNYESTKLKFNNIHCEFLSKTRSSESINCLIYLFIVSNTLTSTNEGLPAVSLPPAAVGKIKEWFPFIKNVYIPPAPHDGGLSLGAAQFVWHQVLDNERVFIIGGNKNINTNLLPKNKISNN